MPTSTRTPSGGSGASGLLLPAALAAQAALLLPRIGLLPVWGDEQHTLERVQASLPHMFDLLRAEFNPPLYFLFLKLWVWLLPWPTALIGEIRLASVGFALAATVAIDRLWLRDVPPRLRRWFLLLWVLSPFLLLYARMGRSYTAQLLVAAFALRYAVDWLRRADMTSALRYAVAESVLLYLHYTPGLALAGVFGVAGLYRVARGDRERVKSLAVAGSVCVVLYLPWLGALRTALVGRVELAAQTLVPNEALDQGIRLAYTFLSLTFGETMPLFGLVAAAALTPPILWALGRGLRGHEWEPVVLGMLPLAYVSTAKHALSLTPSHLLFFLPFYLLTLVRGCERVPRMAAVVVPGLLVTSVVGASSYYRGQDFLNKAYLLPFDAIASYASGPLSRGAALFVVDASNMDASRLLAVLPPAVPVLTGHDEASSREIRRRIDQGGVDRVWFLRTTHDASPERWSARLAAELARSSRLAHRREYVPYGGADRLAMRLLGWPERPACVLELLEFERAAAGAAG